VPSSEFIYTNQGQAEEIDNVNDSDVFRETLDAFKLLDISKSDQAVIFSMISAILHLGNVKIVNERTNESSVVSVNGNVFVACTNRITKYISNRNFNNGTFFNKIVLEN
jgi:myosin heavy subunit